jgi:hypothetical protein
MPNPASSHINAALSNLAVQFGRQAMIADRIFAPFGVAKQSDYYFIVDSARSDLKAADDRRAVNGEPNTIDYAVSNDLYACREHVLGDLVSYAEEENADAPLQPRMTATEMIVRRLAVIKEIEAATLCATVTNTAAASGTTTKWDASDAVPIDDIKARRAAMAAAIGVYPNIGFCDTKVYEALLNSAQVRDRIKSGVLSMAELARVVASIVGLDDIIVSTAMKNTSKTSTASLSAVWGTTFYMAYVNPVAAAKTLTFGLTFDWTKMGPSGYQVSEDDQPVKKGTFIQAARWYDQKIVSASCAAKITACVA